MSEYQYYEFLALDRPLTDAQMAEVGALSTRAEITATRFVNSYHWGSFRGDPQRMVERYYDAHLYVTNWGTRQAILRLPKTTQRDHLRRTAPQVGGRTHVFLDQPEPQNRA